MERLLVGLFALLFVSLGAMVVVAVGSDGFLSSDDASRVALDAVSGQVQEVDFEGDSYEVDVLTANGEQEVIVGLDGEVKRISEEEEDVPITGSALERASAVALAHIGEGRVTASEIGDEEGYYEIEITLDNGHEVDVHLDEDFNVLSTEYD